MQVKYAGIMLATLVLLVALTATSTYKAHGIETLLLTQQDPVMVTYTCTYESALGTQVVSTPRLEGENAADHAARHREAISALQAIIPKAA